MDFLGKRKTIIIEYPIQNIIPSNMGMSYCIKMICDFRPCHFLVFIIQGIESFHKETAINHDSHFYRRQFFFHKHKKYAQGSAHPLSRKKN